MSISRTSSNKNITNLKGFFFIEEQWIPVGLSYSSQYADIEVKKNFLRITLPSGGRHFVRRLSMASVPRRWCTVQCTYKPVAEP